MRLASAWESHYEFRLEPFNSASLARYFHLGIFGPKPAVPGHQRVLVLTVVALVPALLQAVHEG